MVGAAIAATAVAYGVSPLYAFMTSVAVGAAKEVIDPFIGGQRDMWDFVVTAAGAAVVLPKLLHPLLLVFLQAG